MYVCMCQAATRTMANLVDCRLALMGLEVHDVYTYVFMLA